MSRLTESGQISALLDDAARTVHVRVAVDRVRAALRVAGTISIPACATSAASSRRVCCARSKPHGMTITESGRLDQPLPGDTTCGPPAARARRCRPPGLTISGISCRPPSAGRAIRGRRRAGGSHVHGAAPDALQPLATARDQSANHFLAPAAAATRTKSRGRPPAGSARARRSPPADRASGAPRPPPRRTRPHDNLALLLRDDDVGPSRAQLLLGGCDRRSRPSRTRRRTAASISFEPPRGSSFGSVSTGRPTTSGGKSHSCETPTIRSPRPRAQTISVALGSSVAMRSAMCRRSGPFLRSRRGAASRAQRRPRSGGSIPPAHRRPAGGSGAGRSILSPAMLPHCVQKESNFSPRSTSKRPCAPAGAPALGAQEKRGFLDRRNRGRPWSPCLGNRSARQSSSPDPDRNPEPGTRTPAFGIWNRNLYAPAPAYEERPRCPRLQSKRTAAR